ncbi:hypothetical protein GTW25_14890 [Aliihoeflea aestuarii]|uniref:hypothetical protein n=1 Tax=Aliihoeflea aestuarii TaxID=453840 RepID=UPI002096511F|nr:hypothetical protein [Aliihoeflea aestuarii]MCO6392316.1 hypothetical protein [Aliihoeflea aestuarii]
MESVIEALNRARILSIEELRAKAGAPAEGFHADQLHADPFRAANLPAHTPSSLDLKNKRIVAFDARDRQTRIFDLLRNGLLGTVGDHDTRVIAVVAPAHGCGVSTLAANLAFSTARKRQWQVVLATLDPSQTFERLGLRATVADSGSVAGAETIRVQVDGSALYLANLATLGELSGQTVARHTLLRDWIDHVKRECGPTVLILDLPPLPISDDSATVAMMSNTALLVVGVGSSTVADIEACRSSLAQTPHYVVLNKARPHGL